MTQLETGFVIRKKMYYDEYEKMYGDGFYPQLKPTSGICMYKNIIISFKLINYDFKDDFAWVQMDRSVIYGFDRNNGSELLNSLNREAQVNATKIINCGGRIIYPMLPHSSTYRILSQYKIKY